MSDKVKLILILIVMFLLGSGIIAYNSFKDYLHPNPDDTVGNTAGNLNNGGLFCESDGKIYFANAYDENRLYVMDSDESNMKCLTDSPVSNINADDGHVYYYINSFSNVKGTGGFRISVLGLYRADKKSNKTKCMEKVNCGVVQLIGNDLYYQRYDNAAGISLNRMDVRSKETETVMQTDTNPASVSGGRIIYSGLEDDHYIYMYDTASGSISTVCEINSCFPDYEDGYIYFMNLDDDYKLYRYSLAGSEAEKLTDDRCDAYIYCNGCIVYQKNSKTEPAVCMINADGSGSVKLAEGNYTNFGAANGVVYFTEFGASIPMYKVYAGGNGEIMTFQSAAEAAMNKK